jgi:hypothetical protein
MGNTINTDKYVGIGFRGIIPSAADPAAQAYFAATGITGATQQTAINNLVKGLKADGLWSKMKAVYPFVTDNRNLLSYTEDITNAAWLKVNVSVTANTTTAPNGTTTADTFQNTGVSGAFLIQKDIAKSAGTYTQSFYFKKNNNDWVAMYTSDNGANYAIAWFNVNTGVVGTVSAVGNFSAATSAITNVGSGWYRCSLTFTKPLTSLTDTSALIPVADNSLVSVIGQNAFIWGTQIETGSILTTYQPMLGSVQAYIASQFKYNLVNPVDSDAAFRLVFNGGWTHSSTGATPNGTNGFADTKLVPNTQLSAHSIHLSYYSRTQNITQQDSQIGSSNTGYSNQYTIDLYYAGGVNAKVFVAGSYPGNSISNPNTDTLGYMIATRTANNVAKMFMDGSQIGSTLTTTYTGGFSTSSIYIGAQNNGGTAIEFGSKQSAFASIGDGLTDTDAANLYTRVQAYQTALARQI